MSKKSLQPVLDKVLANLNKYAKKNDTLRRGASGVQAHSFDFSPGVVLTAVKDNLQERNIKPSTEQWAKINSLVNNFSNSLKSAYKTKGYIYDSEETGKNVFRAFADSKSSKYVQLKTKFNRDLAAILSAPEDSSFIDMGHQFGYGVAETALAFALEGDLGLAVSILREEKERTEIKTLLEKIPPDFRSKGPNFRIKVEVESKKLNRGTSKKLNIFGYTEAGFIKNVLIPETERVIENTDWSNLKGSPSYRDSAKSALMAAAKGKEAAKGTRTKVKKSNKKTTSSKVFSDKNVVSIKRQSVKAGDTQNWARLLPEINARLEQAVKEQMVAPALVNRTGTFAGSARVISANVTSKGFPSFAMSYDKQPYGVFDRRTGAGPWATPARDPYTIIERGLRRILKDFAIGRFYLTRT